MAVLNSVTVYLGSSGHARPVFYKQARALGQSLAKKGVKVVFGGMNAGAMRSLSHGVIEAGGEVTGVIPTKIRDSERVSREVRELIDVETMWQRKRLMFDLGEALIVMPGGYGTLDEALEAIHWKVLGLHQKPIYFINVEGFFDPVFEFIDRAIERGHMPGDTASAFTRLSDFSALDLNKEISSDATQVVAEGFPHFEDEIFVPTRTPIIIDAPDMAQSYKLMTALVTRQLGAHKRPIGVLNKNGVFDPLIDWVRRARDERFITRKCPSLMTVRKTEAGLMAALERKEEVVIDLHRDKWGS